MSRAYRCDHVKVNADGETVQYFFSRRSLDPDGHDDYVVKDGPADGTEYEEGKYYMIPDRFEPAMPRSASDAES